MTTRLSAAKLCPAAARSGDRRHLPSLKVQLVVVAVATCSYLLIEWPGIRLGRKVALRIAQSRSVGEG